MMNLSITRTFGSIICIALLIIVNLSQSHGYSAYSVHIKSMAHRAFALKLSSMDSNPSESVVFIKNLPFTANDAELRQLFQDKLQIEVGTINIPKDKLTDQPRGFVFVDFQNPDTARRAVTVLNGQKINGRSLVATIRSEGTIKANYAKPTNPNRVSLGYSDHVSAGSNVVRKYESQESDEKTIYMSNLHFSMTKLNIEEMCQDLVGEGLVESVRFPLDRNTGTSRGFCYVTFNDAATAVRAIETLNGVPVLGREVRAVKYEPS